MAEEMAETIAITESKRTGRSTSKNNKSAGDRDPGRASQPVAVALKSKENRREKNSPETGKSECQAEVADFNLHKNLKETIAKKFKPIVDGLLTILGQGNPAGAKVLLDALAKLESDPDKFEHQSEVGIVLSDLLGPDFDWGDPENEDQYGITETAETGVGNGIGASEPEN